MYELRDPGLLKLAMGSDATALARAQLPRHEERLTLLPGDPARAGGIRARRPSSGSWSSPGIGHEREYVRFWKRVAGS